LATGHTSLSPILCVLLIAFLGTILFIHTYKLSHTYGQHWMMKTLTKRSTLQAINSNSRKVGGHMKKAVDLDSVAL